jgi:hypothetical protein
MMQGASFDHQTARAAIPQSAAKPICTGAAAICLAALLASSPIAQANGTIATLWTTAYPSSQSYANAGCLLCHAETTTPLYNIYGISLKLNGVNFAALDGSNSDGDPTGASNLAEINANTQPGWTDGANNSVFDGTPNVIDGAASPPAAIAGAMDPAPTGGEGSPPPATSGGPSVPTLSEWSLGVLAAALAFAGWASRRKRSN